MKPAWIIALSALALTGCSDSIAQPAGDDPLISALTAAMCAVDKDDLVVAIGSVVDASADLEEDGRGSAVIELASDIRPKDCYPEKAASPTPPKR